ncbi:fluoride efflux transporter CrcB [Paucibacter sp. TC2R-5]|uniref:fluoride efflux transporter CrcB n=1 Tax=Paucibacter sp. TC2R-5 TaxID=2893555 RepID=UPI0021E44B42|nr:fluoride efflux transporter CrcB [Paucibacter sp. TC2R-5]MCV2357478.1 fluoride efflux transporter CrcB [Paucibacter sp. TC2R-5]
MTAAMFFQAGAVAGGAAVGALLRWATGLWLNERFASVAGFPLGTLVVNLAGGFMIGMAMAWFGRSPNDLLKLLLVTGFLGGLTTFSAFSAESLALLQRGEAGMALWHAALHTLGGLGCAAAGWRLMQQA